METIAATGRGANCLIISANQVVTPYPVYPLGCAYLAGALTANGHQAEHFDLLADGGLERLSTLLSQQNFDLICVSIRNLDTVDSADPRGYLDSIVETVKRVQAESEAVVVLGGSAFSIMPEQLLKLLKVDYGIVGEGEVLVPWLASEIKGGRRPEQKIFSSKPVQDIWQPTKLTASSARYYTKHGGMLNVQSKRGCPYNCSYCSYPTIEGKTLRFRDPKEVVDEVVYMQKEAGAKYLFFTDSVFNDPQKKYLEIAEELIKRKNNCSWCAFFRPDDISPEELRLLKRAGLSAMELGTDAASDETLTGLRKNFLFEDVLKVHNNIIAEEIACAHFIMLGGPGENEKTLASGLANIEQLEQSVVFAFIGIRILPGTEIYDRAIAEEIIDPDTPLLEPVFYYSPQIERKTIERTLLEAFEPRMDRIYPCHEFESRITRLHDQGHVGPLWNLLLSKKRR